MIVDKHIAACVEISFCPVFQFARQFLEKKIYKILERVFFLRKIAFAESMDAQRIKFLKSNFTTKQLVKNILKNKN